MTIIDIKAMIAGSGVAFGTSGARGLVASMSDEVCAGYTLAFLHGLELTGPGRRIALGMDLRPSSPRIAAACAASIRQAGCEPVFCGVLPTPALAWYALSAQIPAIMVTGSHIPFDRNGIKFYRPEGEITKADEAAMTAMQVDAADIDVEAESARLASQQCASPALLAYERRYTSLFPDNLLGGMRIGVYEHSSAARDSLLWILDALGAETISLGRTDTFVPIDTEAVSAEDRQRGRDWAQQYQLDAIVSTDGDGDRPLIADENGEWFNGDIVGLLTARCLGADTVVVPVSCNTAIEACGWFRRVIRTRIGSPYVIAGMEQALAEGAGGIAGFEANGGFLAGEGLHVHNRRLAALPTRDAVLPILAVLGQAGKAGLAGLRSQLPPRFTASDRLQDVAPTASRMLVERLQHDAAAPQALWGESQSGIAGCDLTDGLRLTFDNGEIVHLRPSGNAPELRCYAEADNMDRARALVAQTLQRIAAGL